ncbi:hypothetical protein THIOM_005600 [Candidatus Thiomargarita nelsonii]|uniref:Uncharacterized protein n=1 Tax=Candidatus Thiomargarita nelsonii TaxID=1003181 RepID=A0A176RSS8_9GAMM|nr:hypothetical protein THIOM_005600 [Candidatus Thiomargarita nelsonii]
MFNVKQSIIPIVPLALELANVIFMTENENPREIAELVESSLREFNLAMQRRETLIFEISAQTAQIIRFSMISLTVWAAAMFALIIILLSDMGNITQRLDEVAGYMKNISQNITVVAGNVYEVKLSLDNLDEHVKVITMMNDSVSKMSEQVFNINTNINDINTSINKINTSVITLNDNIALMRVDMAKMNHQFTGLNSQLGVMGSNVNRMTAPMKFFPFP